MKEQVTSFDLEAAFKALDEIEMPQVTRKTNSKRILDEQFSRRSKFDALFEDYYDVSNPNDLDAAQEQRESEVAQAKLARIERIVDLDAQTAEDLLPSYVGKFIMQCPQCMTLFYKDANEIEHSEEDENTVNVGEKCQHCGNDSGYTLIGKVDAVPEEEMSSYDTSEIDNQAELAEEEPAAVEEEPAEEPAEASAEDEFDLNAEAPMEEVSVEEEEEEKKEESFNTASGAPLNEEVDAELNKKLEEHNEYIKYLQDQIAKEEALLKTEKNEFVKESIKDCITALAAKLEDAIPDDVKHVSEAAAEEPAEEAGEEAEEANEEPIAEADNDSAEEEPALESLNELFDKKTDSVSYTEAMVMNEDDQLPAVSEESMEKLLDSPEFEKPISDEEVQDYLDDASDKQFESLEDIDEETLDNNITEYLKEIYSNIKNCKVTECTMQNNKLIVEACINFKSGKSKSTKFEFEKAGRSVLEGYNRSITADKAFTLNYSVDSANKLITESLGYKYTIKNKLVEGLTNNK